jgi:hypothetical protein
MIDHPARDRRQGLAGGFGDLRRPAISTRNPPRAGAPRARLYGRQPVAHETVQRRVRDAVSQHVGHGAAVQRPDRFGTPLRSVGRWLSIWWGLIGSLRE